MFNNNEIVEAISIPAMIPNRPHLQATAILIKSMAFFITSTRSDKSGLPNACIACCLIHSIGNNNPIKQDSCNKGIVAAHFSVKSTITIGLAAARMNNMIGHITKETMMSVFFRAFLKTTWSSWTFERTGKDTRPTTVARMPGANPWSC